jgi:hypothetical protein
MRAILSFGIVSALAPLPLPAGAAAMADPGHARCKGRALIGGSDPDEPHRWRRLP